MYFYKSEKERGLFATSMISTNEFICEYKQQMFTQAKRHSEREKEYSVNDEGVGSLRQSSIPRPISLMSPED